jgi:hypothetical protein
MLSFSLGGCLPRRDVLQRGQNQRGLAVACV